MDVKSILKKRRLEKNLTLDDVGKLVGVSAATISRWESGDIENMRSDKIVKLANALEISPAVILGWNESKVYPSYEDTEDINYLKNLGESLQYETYWNFSIHFGDSLILKKQDTSHAVELNNNDIQELLTAIKNTPKQLLKNAVEEKYSNKDYYVPNHDLEHIYSVKITSVEDAKAYLSTYGNDIAAFNGGKQLSDKALIQMANILRNENNN
ncbi:helix-turn-helix domain-containing protein [Roseburia inulinivorans]